MPYCKNCGYEIPKGAIYCPNCGTQAGYKHSFMLATWGERVIAYIIDMMILGMALSVLSPIFWRTSSSWIIPFVNLGGRSIVYFLYWTVMEGMYGQSLGKMVMKIEVAHIDGGEIDYGSAAIQAVGKAFLLPLDLILGLVLYPERDQRLFNKISETVVVKKLA
jgi:uncharacterized RDD family membrane protein YckC